MALEITEFAGRTADGWGALDALRRPPLAVQPGLTIDDSGARSATFGYQTTLIRVVASADCRILVYAVPAGDDTTAADPAGADALSEFFPAGEYILALPPGGATRLAVIAAASA